MLLHDRGDEPVGDADARADPELLPWFADAGPKRPLRLHQEDLDLAGRTLDEPSLEPRVKDLAGVHDEDVAGLEAVGKIADRPVRDRVLQAIDDHQSSRFARDGGRLRDERFRQIIIEFLGLHMAAFYHGL